MVPMQLTFRIEEEKMSKVKAGFKYTVKSVEQTRLGFETLKFWKVKFTTNDIQKMHGIIIMAINADCDSVLPTLYQVEDGYCVEPLTGRAAEIIKSLAG